MTSYKVRKTVRNSLLWVGVMFFVAVSIFPLIEAFLSSLKPPAQLFSRSPHMFIPSSVTLGHYWELLGDTKFLIYYFNTTFVTLVTLALVIPISALAAYGLTRFAFPGRDLYRRLILFTYMLPPILLFLPLHAVLTTLGLVNSRAGLVFAYTSFCLPFAIWLLRAFFMGIPVALEEAAMVDGATRLFAFFRIVLPQAVSGIVAVSVFVIVVCWNEYLYALVLTSSDEMRTLPVGLATFIRLYTIDWGKVMASVVLTSVPLVVLYVFVQQHLLKGFAGGAVKG
jgi:multiple sugar transport system permease protein